MSNKEAAKAEKANGNAAYKLKDWDTAIGFYTKAVELDDTDHTFFSNRSACYAGKGDYVNSLADAEQVIALSPEFAKGYTRKALALRKLDRMQESINTYKQGIQKCGQNQALTSGLQSAMQSTGRGMLPRELLTGAMVQNPEIKEWYENDPEFKRRVDVLTTSFPNSQEFTMWMSDDKIRTLLKYINFNFGDDDETPKFPSARKPAAYKREPTPEPEPELTPEEIEKKERQTRADELKAKGTALYKKKQFIDAAKAYEQAAELCPDSPVYLLNQAAAQLMMNDLDSCEECCKKAIKVSSENCCDDIWDAKAYARLATVAEKRGNMEQAITYLTDSLRENNDPKVKRRMKMLKKKIIKNAAEDLLSPEQALEYKNKADDSFRNGKWAESIKFYGESLKRNPDNEKVYNNRATAYCKLMAWDPALQDTQRAIALKPDWVKPYLRKAKVEQAMQRHHRALATLKLAKKNIANPSETDSAFLELQVAIGRANNTKDPQRQQRALQDPDIQAILKDPVVSNLLKRAETDPSEIQKAIMKSEHIRDSIEMLAAAGIIQ